MIYSAIKNPIIVLYEHESSFTFAFNKIIQEIHPNYSTPADSLDERHGCASIHSDVQVRWYLFRFGL